MRRSLGYIARRSGRPPKPRPRTDFIDALLRQPAVLVLDDGRIIEPGSHDEVLKIEGAYAALWRVQTGEPARALDEALGNLGPA